MILKEKMGYVRDGEEEGEKQSNSSFQSFRLSKEVRSSFQDEKDGVPA